MAREFEIIGAGAIGSLLHGKPRHKPEPGTLCPNCTSELVGFYCHVCGQSAEDQHRSFWRLVWEGVEGMTHLDGRLGQTLPALFFNPGKLARDHLEGRRQRHVPPFRLFLISLLIFMFVLEALFHGATSPKPSVTSHQRTIIALGQASAETAVPPIPKPPPAGGPQPASSVGPPPRPVSGEPETSLVDNGADGRLAQPADTRSGFSLWLNSHLKRAIANKEYYSMVLFTWAHRLAILLLPILAALLALVYIRRRQYYIYDHLIVAMQFLSFEFLCFALAWALPHPLRPSAVIIATLWTPVNLLMTLRGAYRSGWITALIKTVFLWVSTLMLFSLLMTGLFTLALAEM